MTGGAYAPNRLYQNRGASNPFNGVTDSAIASADAHDTRGLAVGDFDRDGDLDVVAGNYLGIKRLYLNNGTHDPFQGGSGVNISTSVHVTVGIALGDLDSDGNLDIVEGNQNQSNRLFRRVKHNTARDRLVSWQVPAGGVRIGSARLMRVLGTLPPNTEVNWYLSRNGGVGGHREGMMLGCQVGWAWMMTCLPS